MSPSEGSAWSDRTSMLSTGSPRRPAWVGQDQQVAPVTVGRQQVGVDPDQSELGFTITASSQPRRILGQQQPDQAASRSTIACPRLPPENPVQESTVSDK